MVFALAAGQLGQLPTVAGGNDWRTVFASNAAKFGGDGGQAFDPATGAFRFDQPETLVLKA